MFPKLVESQALWIQQGQELSSSQNAGAARRFDFKNAQYCSIQRKHSKRAPESSPHHKHNRAISTSYSIILRQPHTSIIRYTPTFKRPLPRLLRQNPSSKTVFIAPLCRGFCFPRPVEPPPALFKTVHLSFCKVE